MKKSCSPRVQWTQVVISVQAQPRSQCPSNFSGNIARKSGPISTPKWRGTAVKKFEGWFGLGSDKEDVNEDIFKGLL